MSLPDCKYILLLVSIGLLLSGTAVSASLQTAGGTVTVEEPNFQAPDGSVIHSTLQKPSYATSANPLPGVVVIHGSLQNKEWLMAFGIELARRGFVVLTIDANGHGNSEPGSGSGVAALEYITSLDYVNSSAIGLVGHSMGGGISWSAIRESSVMVESLVLVGSWVPTNTSSVPYIPNLLVTVGSFDSLSTYPTNQTPLEPAFNVSEVEIGVTYGEFSEGTARKLVVTDTNHLFETIDPIIVSESVAWMKDSLKNGVEDAHWIPSNQLVYPLWLLGGFLSVSGAVLTIFPLLAILLGLPHFQDLKKEVEGEYAASTRNYFVWGIIYGIIGLGSFFPLLALGLGLNAIIPFPQSYGLPVMTWILGGALIAAVVLYWKQKDDKDLPWSRLREKAFVKDTSGILKTAILGLVIFFWLYAWTLLVDLGFALDLRCFLPGFNDLTTSRTLFVPIYFIPFFIYFLVDAMWLLGLLRPREETSEKHTTLLWSFKAAFIKGVPYLVVLGVEFFGGMLVGTAVVPGIIGYSFLFFYAFLPWFIACAVISVVAYRFTNNYYLGAIINALITAWLLATILSFR
ncbi:MAG: 2-succinyl-6-hydroxy-2, 4-cyclohexadiene-1-carboxylate synthase [Candidatus Thorarchaeota archaeon]|nr:MAG: 2-succinyl-6-hydroxy-2, 4-cyclohexadiene-1-carboxylate synthase [Candidatus Thorarchaeota archaeon]